MNKCVACVRVVRTTDEAVEMLRKARDNTLALLERDATELVRRFYRNDSTLSVDQGCRYQLKRIVKEDTLDETSTLRLYHQCDMCTAMDKVLDLTSEMPQALRGGRLRGVRVDVQSEQLIRGLRLGFNSIALDPFAARQLINWTAQRALRTLPVCPEWFGAFICGDVGTSVIEAPSDCSFTWDNAAQLSKVKHGIKITAIADALVLQAWAAIELLHKVSYATSAPFCLSVSRGSARFEHRGVNVRAPFTLIFLDLSTGGINFGRTRLYKHSGLQSVVRTEPAAQEAREEATLWTMWGVDAWMADRAITAARPELDFYIALVQILSAKGLLDEILAVQSPLAQSLPLLFGRTLEEGESNVATLIGRLRASDARPERLRASDARPERLQRNLPSPLVALDGLWLRRDWGDVMLSVASQSAV